jgi:opacity protein-like surface antigen
MKRIFPIFFLFIFSFIQLTAQQSDGLIKHEHTSSSNRTNCLLEEIFNTNSKGLIKHKRSLITRKQSPYLRNRYKHSTLNRYSQQSKRYNSTVKTPFLKELFGYRTINEAFRGSIYLTASAGPAILFGDMDGPAFKEISFNKNNMVSIGLKYISTNNFGFKLSYMYGNFISSDIGSKYELTRAYTINTTQSEFSLQGQYFLLGGPNLQNSKYHSLYLFAGFGLIQTNASLFVSGQPQKEATGFTPSKITPIIPFGFGYQYAISKNFNIGAEIGVHYALSDDVDGFNPKGSNFNDFITHISLTLSYELLKGRKR